MIRTFLIALSAARSCLCDSACSVPVQSSSGRQEKERCLLQHSAARLTPEGHPGTDYLDDSKKPQVLENAASSKPGSHSVLGVVQSRIARADAAPEPGASSLQTNNAPVGHGEQSSPVAEAKPTEQMDATRVAPASTAAVGASNKWSLLIELHIPLRMRELHRSKHGPIPRLVKSVKQQLQRGAAIPERRVSVLDVRGDYITLDSEEIDLLEQGDQKVTALLEGVPDPETYFKGNGISDGAFDCKAGADKWKAGWSEDKKAWCCWNEQIACPEETIVDIEILPGESSSDPAPSSVMATWARQMADRESPLRRGPLGSLFDTASLATRGTPTAPEAGAPVVEAAQEPVQERSAGVCQTWSVFAAVLLVSRLLSILV